MPRAINIPPSARAPFNILSAGIKVRTNKAPTTTAKNAVIAKIVPAALKPFPPAIFAAAAIAINKAPNPTKIPPRIPSFLA